MLLPVPYRNLREEQSTCGKLSGQCSLPQLDVIQAAVGDWPAWTYQTSGEEQLKEEQSRRQLCDAPQVADGYTWQHVQRRGNVQTGWIATAYLVPLR
jgi:hypothetical protein